MQRRHARASLTATGLSAAFMTVLVACSGSVATSAPTSSPGPTPPPTTAPTPTPTPTPIPSPTPAVGEIDHPTGATDVVLRAESGGGFVPFGFIATQAPYFTLYGDNTIIFRPTTDPYGTGFPPFVKAVMNPAQVDALLRFALTQGHLATARESYEIGGIADASSTYFTINAGGVKKVVGVYALGFDMGGGQPNPDAGDYAAFVQLNTVLSDFEAEVRRGGQVVSAETYVPTQYRAILIDSQGMEGATPWPWKDLTLADFAVDPDQSSTRLAGITAEQAAAATTVPSGGVLGIPLASPDGKTHFTLSLRPMLPGDKVQPEILPSLGF